MDLENFKNSLICAYNKIALRKQLVCPICGGRFARFLTTGDPPRKNAECPGCGSYERHRLLWLYLQNKTSFFKEKLKILHFAPEQVLQDKFFRMKNIDYVSADLNSPRAQYHMDIMEMSFPSETFDVILCNHVLEHVPDDAKALGELYRVLKFGGWAIVQVPIDPAMKLTLEDPNIKSAADRLKFYGNEDHVRQYGVDYEQRLKKAGFDVVVDGFSKEIGKESNKYCLDLTEDLYFLKKLR
jgi:SAM-dependent methyltransferase